MKCSNHNTSENTELYSLSDIWPTFENLKSKSDHPKLKYPTFRSYIYRQSPPNDVAEYFPIPVAPKSKCYDGYSKICSYHYTPAQDAPIWPSSGKTVKELKKSEEKIIDRLTLDSASKSNFPLFDFIGDFFLKFIVLECYGTILYV